jgi:hypothetical protein
LQINVKDLESSSNYNISQLHKWLDYELGSSVLLFMSYIWGFAFLIAVGAAIAFTPLLIKVLIEERKFGWLTSFVILVLGPPVAVWFYVGNGSMDWVARFVALGNFYIYCGFLRLMISRWYKSENR